MKLTSPLTTIDLPNEGMYSYVGGGEEEEEEK